MRIAVELLGARLRSDVPPGAGGQWVGAAGAAVWFGTLPVLSAGLGL